METLLKTLPETNTLPQRCDHCGLEAGSYPIESEGHVFCCVSCEMVYGALHNAGLEQVFYKLSQEDGRNIRPSDTLRPSELILATLDHADFLEQHTTLNEDGSRSATMFLEGLHCSACVWLIEQMPQFLNGVVFAQVDLARSRFKLRWFPEQVRLSDVSKWVAKFGYNLHPFRNESHKKQDSAERKMLIRLGIAWALAGNIMLLAFALYSGLENGSPMLAQFARWISVALAIPSVVYAANPFFRKAFASLKMAFSLRSFSHLHMDIPIALGISIGFIYSTYITFSGTGEIWFDSLAVLIAALLTARYLHVRSHRLAQDATDQLLALVPSMARRVIGQWTGVENPPFETVSVNALQKNEVILVHAAEVFPADGIIIHGDSSVNNAVLTGESMPVHITIGDQVQAGATNLSVPVYMAVQATGAEARIGKLLAFVTDGADKNAQIVLWADRIGGYFIAVMLALAVFCFGYWMRIDSALAIHNTVALLVIMCPCALGMATPLAMAIAAGRAARQGIYIKNSATIQQLGAIDTVILDKTGTITEGNLSIFDTVGNNEALEKAALLETFSTHPIAQAFGKRFPHTSNLMQSGKVEIKGVHVENKGMSGWVKGDFVQVGRPDWLTAQLDNHKSHAGFNAAFQRFAEEGATPVAIAINGVIQAGAALGDRIRPEAFALIRSWTAQHKSLYILSGDHPDVVKHVGKALGLPESHLYGHCSPEAKQTMIQTIQSKNHKVMMVGDGVNDAAALRQAEVGVAVHGGSTAGMVAADVFLTSGGLQPIDSLLHSSKIVLNVVKRNLAFSLIYNAFGAFAAIMGWVNPLVAAFAMPLSSFVVVGSSILQPSFRPFKKQQEP